jgi:hypothetical protein
MDQNREPESILHLPQFHAFDARVAPGHRSWEQRGLTSCQILQILP